MRCYPVGRTEELMFPCCVGMQHTHEQTHMQTRVRHLRFFGIDLCKSIIFTFTHACWLLAFAYVCMRACVKSGTMNGCDEEAAELHIQPGAKYAILNQCDLFRPSRLMGNFVAGIIL